eukprot:scaffold57411_cov65-Phaeocystis_antarctica.AAC.1
MYLRAENSIVRRECLGWAESAACIRMGIAARAVAAAEGGEAAVVGAAMVAHAVVDEIIGASRRAPRRVLVPQLAGDRAARLRGLTQHVGARAVVHPPPVAVERNRALDRERQRGTNHTARLVIPRLWALQRDPVRNGRTGHMLWVVGMGDVEMLHRSPRLAPVEVGVQQCLLRAVDHVAEDIGRLTWA